MDIRFFVRLLKLNTLFVKPLLGHHRQQQTSCITPTRCLLSYSSIHHSLHHSSQWLTLPTLPLPTNLDFKMYYKQCRYIFIETKIQPSYKSNTACTNYIPTAFIQVFLYGIKATNKNKCKSCISVLNQGYTVWLWKTIIHFCLPNT